MLGLGPQISSNDKVDVEVGEVKNPPPLCESLERERQRKPPCYSCFLLKNFATRSETYPALEQHVYLPSASTALNKSCSTDNTALTWPGPAPGRRSSCSPTVEPKTAGPDGSILSNHVRPYCFKDAKLQRKDEKLPRFSYPAHLAWEKQNNSARVIKSRTRFFDFRPPLGKSDG